MEGERADPFEHYDQTKDFWASTMYSNHGDKDQTISNSGCGPTTLAMIVSTLLSKRITPDVMGNVCVELGVRTYDSGTDSDAPKKVAEYYGLHYRELSFDYVTNPDIALTLNTNPSAYVYTSAGAYVTAGGHAICISDIVRIDKEAYYVIWDSNYAFNARVRVSQYPGILIDSKVTGKLYGRKKEFDKVLKYGTAIWK